MRRYSCGNVLVLIGLLLGVAPGGERSPASKQNEKDAPDRLVIHEWGTFTCLEDESGRPITGVNTDDEAVPEFVHRISDLIPHPSELAPIYKKGVPRSHRQVRMRLETPVIYFHPPGKLYEPLQATVQVGFHGGWLTEYYPAAKVSAPGLDNGDFNFSRLNSRTLGTLEWHDLTIGGDYALPETDFPVWLAPRKVEAAKVRTADGEAEKYLFYRGVGNLPSPITIARTETNDGIIIREDLDPDLGLRAPLLVRAMWLVHVRDDGAVAFSSLGAAKLSGQTGRELKRIPLDFGTARSPRSPVPREKAADRNAAPVSAEKLMDSYAAANLAGLRSAMRKELIADGLYADEADAMLKTWELAYFKSPGLRLFYLLPQQWTDAVLPLRCSLLADVSRTMVGRVELVTPKQRKLLRQIGQTPVSEINWFYKTLEGSAERNDALTRLWEGKVRFDELGIPIPADYRAYIDLGRFRNALILDEHTRHPQAGLGPFVDVYHLEYYTTEDEAETASVGGSLRDP